MTIQDPDPFDDAMATIALRKAWAESLCFAIRECHPQDAAQIMTAALADMEAGMPIMHWATRRDIIRAEAMAWAAEAPQHELHEFAAAAIAELPRRAMGQSARRGLIAALWAGLNADDRAAFIARVTA